MRFSDFKVYRFCNFQMMRSIAQYSLEFNRAYETADRAFKMHYIWSLISINETLLIKTLISAES